ncbi:MAG TPA: acylphosphatase [Chitinophagaceae bacterium]|nr:acylphosphatase [Chitinophagaceae bacterium]
MKTFHLIASGKVQGVFYRDSAKATAQALDLNGWVKNCKNGDVEILVSGPEREVSQFIEWCKAGPANASVTGLTINEVDPVPLSRFEIRT